MRAHAALSELQVHFIIIIILLIMKMYFSGYIFDSGYIFYSGHWLHNAYKVSMIAQCGQLSTISVKGLFRGSHRSLFCAIVLPRPLSPPPPLDSVNIAGQMSVVRPQRSLVQNI